MMALNVNEQNIKAHKPMDFKLQPTYQKGLEMITPSEMETGGAEIRKPLAFAYAKNI